MKVHTPLGFADRANESIARDGSERSKNGSEDDSGLQPGRNRAALAGEMGSGGPVSQQYRPEPAEALRAKQAGAYGTPVWNESVELYIKMLAPVAPYVTEELWSQLGRPYSIHTQDWPQVDEAAAREDEITLVLQVNGKVRDRLVVAADIMKPTPNRPRWRIPAFRNSSKAGLHVR